MSLVIGDLAAIEPKVANNSEIYLADINIALEDDNNLKYALSVSPDISFMRYEIKFELINSK